MFTEKFKKQTKKRTLTYCLKKKRQIGNNTQVIILQGISQTDDFQSNFH